MMATKGHLGNIAQAFVRLFLFIMLLCVLAYAIYWAVLWGQRTLFAIRVGHELEIEPSWTIVKSHILEQFEEGTHKDAVFSVLDKVDGIQLDPNPTPGNLYGMDVECYVVSFHPSLGLHELDQIFCFDTEEKIFWAAPLAGFR